MNDECLICGAPLIYTIQEEAVCCAICGKGEYSSAQCEKGHYVCDSCHTRGLDQMISLCLTESSKNPYFILEKMMDAEPCHMHGPEHHILVGVSLLTAYHNAGGKLDLSVALQEMIKRGSRVPGGACGLWGSCGAAISTGIFLSIVTESNPLSVESYGLVNLMTSQSLEKIGTIGGPRCCKRNSYLALTSAIEYVEKHLGIVMESSPVSCKFFPNNNQCIKGRCPIHPKKD